ncbi:MAG: transposase, partial [Bacteroidales bacterium]|nr:transposase [Bacteroidales bacterium]
ADIVKEDKLNILEYNICGDHMHILLVCEEEDLPKIVGKLKAMTARACNIATGRTIPGNESDSATTRGHVPLSGSVSPDRSEKPGIVEETRGHVPLSGSDSSTNTKIEKKKYNSLWTQKFGKRKINGKNDLQNVINYIRTNRQKHELPENKKLERIIGKMTCSVHHAFRT